MQMYYLPTLLRIVLKYSVFLAGFPKIKTGINLLLFMGLRSFLSMNLILLPTLILMSIYIFLILIVIYRWLDRYLFIEITFSGVFTANWTIYCQQSYSVPLSDELHRILLHSQLCNSKYFSSNG